MSEKCSLCRLKMRVPQGKIAIQRHLIMLADFAMADAASCWMALSCFLFVLLSPSLDFVALARPDCPSSLSPGAVHTWSRAEELLHEIGQDCSTPAVQVKAVAMQTPAISLSN